MFKGSLTALITPFKGGKVDDGAFQRLVEWQIAEGTHGLVPVGTTGESPTLSHDGLYRHFKAISDAVDIPIFLYNVPVRTIVDIQVATMARCAELKNVVGVKDATANVGRVTQQRLTCGKDFVQLSGEDSTVLGFMAHGGHGCISVTSNVAPRLCADFQNACAA